MYLFLNNLASLGSDSLASGVLSFLQDLKVLKGIALKETRQEQLARIREAWKPWQERLNKEAEERNAIRVKYVRTHIQFKKIKGLAHGNNKGQLKELLRKFWDSWKSLESDELRLATLINMASRFSAVRVPPKRLRKLRKKYNQNKHSLLNVPFEKCGTCEKPATVRHHIIPLTHGGINSPLNLILICDTCHEEIHPWMKA